MDEIVSFFKEILMINGSEKAPIGLCGFEYAPKEAAPKVKREKKREMRLSELMDK